MVFNIAARIFPGRLKVDVNWGTSNCNEAIEAVVVAANRGLRALAARNSSGRKRGTSQSDRSSRTYYNPEKPQDNLSQRIACSCDRVAALKSPGVA